MATSTTSLSTGTSSLALSGLASGFDWQSLVSQLVTVERQPETQLQSKQSTLELQKAALGSIKTELSVLQSNLANLKTPGFFDSRTATPSDATLASATAAKGTALGTYSFSVSQLATAAALQGASGAGGGLSRTDDVSSLALSAAGFSTSVTAGTFTVNGAQVTIATSDTLQSVFDQINQATGGAVTASYSAANDQITLSSTSGNLVLGSATDTSNFLQAAKLSNPNPDLVTSSAKLGTAGTGLSATDDVSKLVLGTAGFGTPVTAGTFTVNGTPITLSTSDTLQSVFDQINQATGGAVTASYSAATDQITLSSKSPLVLGSATDTSNFLQAAKLNNPTPGTVTSYARLGAAVPTASLSHSNLATAVTGDASGNGSFSINGVTINYNLTSDSINDVLSRINDSGAGVIGAYDQVNNRFTLTNKTTGDVGIALQDGPGSNFLAATGLSSATLLRGTNLLYQVNGGPQQSSLTNTIAAGNAGITGLSVTALAKGNFTVKVGADTATIKTAITNFVTEYNKVQSVIGAQTASSTDTSGKVTAGVLTGDMQIESLTNQLRDLMTSATSQLAGTLHLSDLGFTSSGQTDTLSTTDLSGLDTALANNLGGLKDLFTNPTNGLAAQMDTFLTSTAGDNGSLVTEQNSLTDQSKSIDTQISHIEAQVLAYQQQLTTEFVAMETAEAKTNQQLSYLQKVFA